MGQRKREGGRDREGEMEGQRDGERCGKRIGMAYKGWGCRHSFLHLNNTGSKKTRATPSKS